MLRTAHLFTLLFWVVVSSASQAQGTSTTANWHRFRGPLGTGVAPQANPPLNWDIDTNIRWKVAVPGKGSGSPIVWGDRIYLQTAIKTDRTSVAENDTHRNNTKAHYALQTKSTPPAQLVQESNERRSRGFGPPIRDGERRRRRGGFGFGRGSAPTNVYEFVVLCYDRNTGDILWQKTACEAIPHEGHHGTASFASATPVTDGKNLYVSFGSRGIYSYDMDGNFRWKRDLGKMRTRNSFGEGASPALHGDTLIINWDEEEQSFITALDTNTGDTRWRVDRDEATSWTTPFIVEYDGIVQVVVNGTNRVRSYDLKNGELVWECGGQASNPVSTPVVYEDLAIVMTGRRGYAVQAISLASRGDVTDSDQVAWSRDEGTPYVPSPLLSDNRLYYSKSNNAILTCVNALTGEVYFKNKRLPDLDAIYSSPVGAAGRIYISGRDGTTLVIKDDTELEILATNTLGETIDATPAIVGNEIFIRGENHLFCIAE